MIVRLLHSLHGQSIHDQTLGRWLFATHDDPRPVSRVRRDLNPGPIILSRSLGRSRAQEEPRHKIENVVTLRTEQRLPLRCQVTQVDVDHHAWQIVALAQEHLSRLQRLQTRAHHRALLRRREQLQCRCLRTCQQGLWRRNGSLKRQSLLGGRLRRVDSCCPKPSLVSSGTSLPARWLLYVSSNRLIIMIYEARRENTKTMCFRSKKKGKKTINSPSNGFLIAKA